MSDEKHEMELDPGAAIVRGFMYRALEIMARDLQERAAEADGALDGDAVAASLAGMKDPKSPVMGAICRAAWQECESLFESEARKEDRKAPFERLMVWPFAHLLPAGGNRDGGEETISRRIIPGYLAAIEDLVGPVVFGPVALDGIAANHDFTHGFAIPGDCIAGIGVDDINCFGHGETYALARF